MPDGARGWRWSRTKSRSFRAGGTADQLCSYFMGIEMNILTSSWTEAWNLIVWGNGQLQNIAYYVTIITFLGVMYNLFHVWKSRRPVKIIVVNAERPEERSVIGTIPRKMVTRAEVMGFVGKAAGGETLNFQQFKFDYNFRKQIEVILPTQSYCAVTERPQGAAVVAAA
jgi:hypothetical protein